MKYEIWDILIEKESKLKTINEQLLEIYTYIYKTLNMFFNY